ncbi:hypothetical protein E4U17_001666 [Claviceps sp. LM77 group G4]|nr:hypothetical protein E4U17_001666 [Claviceps sp. LM77 group G4]KAG6051365.1 hypothetical protein E4U33_000615 [Claviceps sp. LM78 group G4]KAG6063758.1 hypothetical protein E4U16_000821 [Claviceps sp. LM84 group G4]
MSIAVDQSNGVDPIRIVKIAGRYLIFEPDAVARLRRYEHMNGTLVGTTPQQPTQNVFLGLPVEMRPEAVEALLQKKSAYVLDDANAHSAVMRYDRSTAPCRSYIASLRNSKQAAALALTLRSSSKSVGRRLPESSFNVINSLHSDRGAESLSLSTHGKTLQCGGQDAIVGALAVTPGSSSALVRYVGVSVSHAACATAITTLCAFLQSRGHYMTPGLRFGSRYSVYPGDPLRFHAHFMADQYDWEEQIPILDIIGGGRLATAVKKAYLIGGRVAPEDFDTGPIRTYSIEWAAM